MTGRSFAFLGSGEFEPWHDEIDRWLLERAGGNGSVLVVPTASAPEGDHVFDDWAAKGLAHYRRLGVPASVAPIRSRSDADREDVVALIDDASVVFFSGGNPFALAEALRGSAWWARVVERLHDGLGFAGCSAGVSFLNDMTVDTTVMTLSADTWKPGLGLVNDVRFGLHWDTVDRWIPGATARIEASLAPGQVLVGIDEETAMVGDGSVWRVVGRAGVHVLRAGTWSHHTPGDAFELMLAGASA
jgi:cyanophycinase